MKRVLKSIYYFLPVQLVFLHFRKYQLLLGFWLILLLTITGNFAVHFGASSLFLAPEYLGNISFTSMYLLGSALCVFIMMWNITTFIIHSKRIPYMGATRNAFLVYCLNNSIIPLFFLDFYSIVAIRFQWHDEHSPWRTIILMQLGFYLGILTVMLLSFAYFFRVSRDYFKVLLSKITNPARIRSFIPYDSLDYEVDIIPARSFISGRLTIEKSESLEPYHPRVMATVLRRHHRNVIFATLVAYLFLLLTGIFMEEPLLRIPAGAGFLLLFAIVMGVVGAFKYFLKSWETLGWVLFVVLLSAMVRDKIFDLRSIAYGVNYRLPEDKEPKYDYEALRSLFTLPRYLADKKTEEERLQRWKARTTDGLPPLVVVTVSGGGSRAAYWSFRTLQYIDSVSKGKLFQNTVLITGASGGMIGAAYWRSIHDAWQMGQLKGRYEKKYQDNIGKDILNSIIFSLASVDLVSPFNKISVGGYSYTRDRGYAMERELARNTDGLLDKNIGYFRQREANGSIPEMIVAGTVVNDGRKLLVSGQPVGYLTQPEYSLKQPTPPIDAIDYAAFFAKQDPYNLQLTSALRMNATFPFILPVVRFPAQPAMNIMDAGLADNFGKEIATRYLYVLRDWIQKNTRGVVFLEIRDTRENDVTNNDDMASLGEMVASPLFVIQNKWEAFQSYTQCSNKDYTPWFLGGHLRYITMQYVPKESTKIAALNFHLTQDEKEDIYQSIYYPENLAAVDSIVKAIQ